MQKSRIAQAFCSKLFFRRALIIALAYVALGKISLLLAIPPSYSAPIFPPAGLALAVLLLFGDGMTVPIWFASFILNLGSFSLRSEEALFPTLLIPTALAFGSCLQALVGAVIIRRWVKFPTPLARPGDILTFLILGGPVASLVRATMASVLLLAAGVLSEDTFSYAWWSSWIGDTLGVFVFTPLILTFFSEPREAWAKRRFSVAIPLCLTLMLNLVILLYVGAREKKQIDAEFERDADVLANRVRKSIEGYVGCLYAVESALVGMKEDDPGLFRAATQRWLSLYPGIHDFSWNPRVLHSRRKQFENRARQMGKPNYVILETGRDGGPIPAEARDEYFPSLFAEPAYSTDAMGFDQASSSDRLEAMERARDHGGPSMAGPVRMLQRKPIPRQTALMVYLPIYEGEAHSLEMRRKNLKGFAKALFRMEDVIEAAAPEEIREQFGLTLWLKDPIQEKMLYSPHWAGRVVSSASDENFPDQWPTPWETSLPLADRELRLRVSPTNAYVLRRTDLGPWVVLGSILTMSGLLVSLFLMFTGHTFAIEQELVERRRVSEQLARSNAELEQFGYVVSHDLQEPLRMISSYLQLIHRRLGTLVDAEVGQFMNYTLSGAERMKLMIRDLLEYSKVGRSHEVPKPVEIRNVIEEAVQNLRVAIQESGAEITVGEMPKLSVVKTEWTQLFQNLVGNAVKYRDPQRRLRIEISAEQKKEDWEFAVRDNGIGIAPEAFGRIFLVFQRLHSRSDYPGTGVGLAICKKVVEEAGGRIWVESTVGVGSRFLFTLPLREA